MKKDFKNMPWFDFLEHSQKDLILQAQDLYLRELKLTDQTFHDYSFVVFPMAKGYEGFLKKYFFSLGFISKKTYEGDHFRIGKSLNPDLPEKYRRYDWVVESLNNMCGVVGVGRFTNQLLSRVLWQCWKRSRNLLFHYFPHHENFITLEEAGLRIDEVSEAINAAMECKYELGY